MCCTGLAPRQAQHTLLGNITLASQTAFLQALAVSAVPTQRHATPRWLRELLGSQHVVFAKPAQQQPTCGGARVSVAGPMGTGGSRPDWQGSCEQGHLQS